MHTPPDRTAVHSRVVELLSELVGGAELLDFPITAQTRFHDDLELESIDLVTFAGIIDQEFGMAVNLPAYLSELDLEEIIALTVGDIVGHVVGQLDVSSDERLPEHA